MYKNGFGIKKPTMVGYAIKPNQTKPIKFHVFYSIFRQECKNVSSEA